MLGMARVGPCSAPYKGGSLYPELSFIPGFLVVISIASLILLDHHVVSLPSILISSQFMLWPELMTCSPTVVVFAIWEQSDKIQNAEPLDLKLGDH